MKVKAIRGENQLTTPMYPTVESLSVSVRAYLRRVMGTVMLQSDLLHKTLDYGMSLPDINKDKQNNPDDINKVPKNRSGIDTKMTCIVVTRNERATKNKYLQQNASKNVQTVETCQ